MLTCDLGSLPFLQLAFLLARLEAYENRTLVLEGLGPFIPHCALIFLPQNLSSTSANSKELSLVSRKPLGGKISSSHCESNGPRPSRKLTSLLSPRGGEIHSELLSGRKHSLLIPLSLRCDVKAGGNGVMCI